MFILDEIEITGFWGDKKIKTNLNSDVNIFIGDNGTGKTTFINIIYSLLSMDLNMIANIQFNEVIMQLSDNNKKRKIAITREVSNSPYVLIKYRIGKNAFEFPLLIKDIEYNRRRIQHPQYIEKIKSCKILLESLVNLSWISVYRDTYYEHIEDNYFNKKESNDKLPIDNRLDQLMIKLTKYQLQMESKASESSTKFQRDVLEGLLYNSKFDIFDFEKWSSEKFEKIQDGLVHAYKDLGFFDDDIEKKVEKHSIQIQKSLVLFNSKEKDRKLTINDVLPLVLLNRTNHIISLSKKLEQEKNEIYKQLHLYKKVVEDFLVSKEIDLEQIRNGMIRNKNNNKYIPISSLSSGKKQLLIILTEALLQKNNRFIFIADEPELSLHITWQKRLIKAIKEINTNTQIIVATHSPEIAALWSNNIVNIESVFENV